MPAREKIILEFGYRKNEKRIDENLFSRLSGAMNGNMYPVEAYIQKQGVVQRKDQELSYIDVRVYLKDSTVLG